jgi:hypothetical protein
VVLCSFSYFGWGEHSEGAVTALGLVEDLDVVVDGGEVFKLDPTIGVDHKAVLGATAAGCFAGNRGRRLRSSVPIAPTSVACSGRSVRARTARRWSSSTSSNRASRSAALACTGGSSARASGLACRGSHELRHTFGAQAIRKFKVHEVQRVKSHRHITTTERYLPYTPHADWGGEADRAVRRPRRRSGRLSNQRVGVERSPVAPRR